jgi:hypothetical protein
MFEEMRWLSPYGLLVSTKGVVKRRSKRTGLMTPSKFYPDRKGYYKVCTDKGVKSVARLVAMAFIPNPENKPQVAHLDGIKENNNVENLVWATALENNRHKYLHGTMIRGELHKKAKLSDQIIREIRGIDLQGTSRVSIAKKYKVSVSLISRIIKGERWSHVK